MKQRMENLVLSDKNKTATGRARPSTKSARRRLGSRNGLGNGKNRTSSRAAKTKHKPSRQKIRRQLRRGLKIEKFRKYREAKYRARHNRGRGAGQFRPIYDASVSDGPSIVSVGRASSCDREPILGVRIPFAPVSTGVQGNGLQHQAVKPRAPTQVAREFLKKAYGIRLNLLHGIVEGTDQAFQVSHAPEGRRNRTTLFVETMMSVDTAL